MSGDEIVIAPSGKSAWESEVRKIASVSADKLTLTLNDSLGHDHAG